MPYWITN